LLIAASFEHSGSLAMGHAPLCDCFGVVTLAFWPFNAEHVIPAAKHAGLVKRLLLGRNPADHHRPPVTVIVCDEPHCR
jgi:hypothetical protein